MRICSPCLFYDNENHIWRFYVNDNRELMYSIMYDEDKWTKENTIDSEVLDFTVNCDKDKRIYIIYSVRMGGLKYCVWNQSKWLGKTIYSFENENYEMTELNVITIGELMHIFFIERNRTKEKLCSLLHLCLKKDGNLVNTIYNIPFLKEVSWHYQIQNLENGNLNLLFIKQEKNEAEINLTEYKNNKWSIPRRLYGVIGNGINFCTLVHLDKINIMNLSKEGSLYFLEHVIIEADGKMKSFKIHEGYNKPKDFFLIEISGVLWAIWIEGRNIISSSYKNQWSEASKYYAELDYEISTYKYLSLSDKYNNIKSKYIFGTNPPEIRVLLPKSKENGNRYEEVGSSKVEQKTKLDSDDEETKVDAEDELLVLKKTNKNLEKKLIDLQIKYQQKLKIIEESDDNFLKLVTSKKKIQEKMNIITEIQQSSIKELEKMKAEKISRDGVINEINNKLKELTNEFEALRKQKISKDNAVKELTIKLQELTNENEELKQELNYEKNIGIVDRILKKKPER